MQTSVLLSIKPEFANAILEGRKLFEYRRSLFRQPVKRVVLYASSPVQRVIGEFSVKQVLEMRLDDLWKVTRVAGGISKAYFDEYFTGKKSGHAIQVGSVRRYREPKDLKAYLNIAHPPQSFCYIS